MGKCLWCTRTEALNTTEEWIKKMIATCKPIKIYRRLIQNSMLTVLDNLVLQPCE